MSWKGIIGVVLVSVVLSVAASAWVSFWVHDYMGRKQRFVDQSRQLVAMCKEYRLANNQPMIKKCRQKLMEILIRENLLKPRR